MSSKVRTCPVCGNKRDADEEDSAALAETWFEELISQLGFGFRAGEAMEMLVQDNYRILDKYINNRIINTFVSLNKSKGPQARFLNFLLRLNRPLFHGL